VRPDTENRDAILGSLRSLDASIICVAPGIQAKQLEPYRDAHVTYALQPIDVEPLTQQADVVPCTV
jgi:hypothetical protein